MTLLFLIFLGLFVVGGKGGGGGVAIRTLSLWKHCSSFLLIFFFTACCPQSTNGNGYIKFQYVGYWNEMFSYMIGFLIFFATLKFLKLLR